MNITDLILAIKCHIKFSLDVVYITEHKVPLIQVDQSLIEALEKTKGGTFFEEDFTLSELQMYPLEKLIEFHLGASYAELTVKVAEISSVKARPIFDKE